MWEAQGVLGAAERGHSILGGGPSARSWGGILFGAGPSQEAPSPLPKANAALTADQDWDPRQGHSASQHPSLLGPR